MKNLSDYINEHLEEEDVFESKGSSIKIKLVNADDYDKIYSAALKEDIYIEKTDDNEVKIKIKEGDNVDDIVKVLNNIKDSLKEDQETEKNTIDEYINKIQELAAEEVDEEPEKKDEKDNKKEEE